MDIQTKIDETEQLKIQVKLEAEKTLAFLQGRIEAFRELLPDVLTTGSDAGGADETPALPDGEPS